MPPSLWLALTTILAAGIKLGLLWAGRFPFNADEAVVALMARHILNGERPVFFYGQAYMGSLDAWLVALGFAIFGQHVWVIRFIQIILFLGIILTSYGFARQLSGEQQTGLITALLLAVPSVNVTLYTTVSIGGYGEALLIGNFLLWLGWRIGQDLDRESQTAWWMWFAWGFFAGLGLWAFGLTLVYSLPSGLFILWMLIRQGIRYRRWKPTRMVLWCMAGVLIGASPWIYFAFQNGVIKLIAELGGGAIAGVEGLPYHFQIIKHVISFIILGIPVILGIRPPWNVSWLVLPLIPVVLFFWIWVFWQLRSKYNLTPGMKSGLILLLGVVGTVILGFIFTPFGADPSGRYFLPLTVPLAIFAALSINKLKVDHTRLARGMIILVMLYNLLSLIQVATRMPPGITTQFDPVSQIDHQPINKLVKFLRENGETRGYTNYWVSYPLAFISSEEIIFTPRLPYHQDFRYTSRDNRYPPYEELVEGSAQVAYITALNPALDEYLRMKFRELEVLWDEAQIGDYRVYFRLSRVVRPEEINLGMTTQP